jgi:MFS family permease
MLCAAADVANLGLMMWLPVMVQSLLSGADPMQLAGSSSSSSSSSSEGGASPNNTGVSAVLLSAIPFTSAALAVTFFGHHAQRTGKPPLWYFITFCWIGGVALVGFHWVVEWSRVIGFCCLILTLSCAFAASPHPPTVVAKLTIGPAAALALPLYNSVAMMGGFFGPALMGWFVQHLGGFGAATAVLGGSMVLSGFLALLLQHIMMQDVNTRPIAAGRSAGGSFGGNSAAGISTATSHDNAACGLSTVAVGSGEVADGYEVVYRRSSSSIKRNGAARGAPEAVDSELARLVHDQHQASDGLIG